ncbi:MAG: S46 family peptidase [Bacteroidetes bacterium]|nr:S46 family peptidase [Bacteroidota bacterium]
MMKKIFILFVTSALFISAKVKADEGMWLPLLVERLNYVDMQKMGCHLTAEEIYSVNHSSIKDAIVSINNGRCTGSMISSEGLLLTNHHCAYNYIQNHSTVEKDYLKNGFWALNRIEELRNDKLTATFLISMEDVSGKILPYLKDNLSESERKAIVDSLSSIIEKQAVKGNLYTAKVIPFFEGNEYYLFITETYKDVRLVGAPPEAIGKFGGDTDNWMWPRETGDFSLFRIYMSPEGTPAEYSKKNVPYKPKYSLPISLKGVKKDDFTMILGFPGTTDRFITSYGVKLTLELNTAKVKIRKSILSIMSEDMKASKEVDIKYASKYAVISNYYKYYIGQSEQLEKLKIYDKKVAIENSFIAWYSNNPTLKKKYGTVLDEISKLNDNVRKYAITYSYYREAIMQGIELLVFANSYEELYKQLKIGAEEDTLNRLTQTFTYAAKQFFKNYNIGTDTKKCSAMMEMFNDDVPKEFLPDIYTTIQNKYKESISAYVDEMYNKSIFVSKDKLLEFLAKADYKKLDKDLGYITMISFYNKYKEVAELYNNAKLELAGKTRLFVDGIIEQNKDKKYYPNANSTMRLTYGKISDYNPSPSKSFGYYTTLKDLIDKENHDNSDFEVPPKLKQLYESKDYGKYSTDGEMRTCFISNNDQTGGMSGSPVINGNGELVGVAFDINWEATSVPILFDENYQRSIEVDIKYMLFIIDKYAGATNIIKELTLKE